MTQYLIAFYDPPGIPEAELSDAARDGAALVREARDAGVWVFGGGLRAPDGAAVVAPDGAITDGPFPESKELLAGFGVVDVPSRAVALEWAEKIAVACRCPQEVREFLPDLAVEEKWP